MNIPVPACQGSQGAKCPQPSRGLRRSWHSLRSRLDVFRGWHCAKTVQKKLCWSSAKPFRKKIKFGIDFNYHGGFRKWGYPKSTKSFDEFGIETHDFRNPPILGWNTLIEAPVSSCVIGPLRLENASHQATERLDAGSRKLHYGILIIIYGEVP